LRVGHAQHHPFLWQTWPAHPPATSPVLKSHTLDRPDDVCDSHEAVVNGDAEVVHGQSTAPEKHKVTERVGVPGDLSSDGVLDRYVLGLMREQIKSLSG